MRETLQQARYSLSESFRLIQKTFFASLVVALLVMLPSIATVLSGYSLTSDIYAAWDAFLKGSGEYDLFTLALATSQYSGEMGLSGGLFTLLGSILLTPLLMGALALIYLGRLEGSYYTQVIDGKAMSGGHTWTLQRALGHAQQHFRDLVFVALASMFASYMIELLPRLLGGLLSALVSLLSLIPFLSVVLVPVAAVIMLLLNGVAVYAVTVLLCYIWQAAMNEGTGGMGALMRSIMLVRSDLKRTATAMAVVTLGQWAAYLLVTGLWYLGYRSAGLPIVALPLLWRLVDGLASVWSAAVAAALFASHPYRDGNGSGNVRHMKSANL